MKHRDAWLFLEPSTHLVRQDSLLLLYNTVSKTVLEWRATPEILQLADALGDPDNGYVAPLPQPLLNDPGLRQFIDQLRIHFLGDLLDPSWSAGKPVNIVPEPLVRYGLTPPPDPKSAFSPRLDARNYIHELTLFLNSDTAPAAPLPHAWLQFSFPGCITGQREEMELNLFRAVVDDLRQYTPSQIHISGRDILTYPALSEAVRILSRIPFQKKYHLHAGNWERERVAFLLDQKNTTLAVYVSFPAEGETLAGHLKELTDPKRMKKIEFNLIVSSGEEWQRARELISHLDLRNVFFKPYLTGSNLDFFRENVFVSREEILSSQPDQQQVLSRISVNEHDFGKFHILPGGEVLANPNDPPLGSAHHHSLIHLVISELEKGISWRRSRREVVPCKTCRYQFLCPPVSSYEIFLNRYNFCTVYPNGNEP